MLFRIFLTFTGLVSLIFASAELDQETIQGTQKVSVMIFLEKDCVERAAHSVECASRGIYELNKSPNLYLENMRLLEQSLQPSAEILPTGPLRFNNMFSELLRYVLWNRTSEKNQVMNLVSKGIQWIGNDPLECENPTLLTVRLSFERNPRQD